MSVFRSILLISVVTLAAAFALFSLGSAIGYEEFSGGYAVLSFDSSSFNEDRLIVELLKNDTQNLTGTPVSITSQWVMLDTFGSLEAVPLETYSSRVFSFDPRNDGYAEKLTNVFLKDGKRLIFVPLNKGNWNSALLDRHFKNLLGEINFSAEYYGTGKPVYLYFIAYAAASLGMLIICFIKKNTNLGTLKIIPLIPVLSSLAFFGSTGIICAAFLFGIFFLLREPFNELLMMPAFFSKFCLSKDNCRSREECFSSQTYLKKPVCYKSPGINKKLDIIYKETINPYKLNWIILLLFASALAAVVIISQVKAYFFILVFASALALFFISSKLLMNVKSNRGRFHPVMIIKRRPPEFTFSYYMIPFAVAAVISVLLTSFVSGAYVSEGKFDNIIEEADYYSHLHFQSTFSTRQLGTSIELFFDFIYDEDGIPSPQNMKENSYVFYTDNYPPFPLAGLMDFFKDVNSGGRTESGDYIGISEKIAVLILLLCIIPFLFIKRKSTYTFKTNISVLKQKTGKLRWNGILRSKTLLHNSKNQTRLLKDA